MKRTVFGIVDAPAFADAAVRRLVAFGVDPQDIVVLDPGRHEPRDIGFEAKTKAPEGALIGIGFGAMLGATLGLAAAIAGAFPGLIAFTAGAAVIAALTGAAVGALLLGLVGAIVGGSIPEIETKVYESQSRTSSILIAVHAEHAERVRHAKTVLRSVVASEVRAMDEATLPLSSRA